jgi:mono/diheme cytochrome c family protein
MCTAFPDGETNRLFVAERGGTIQCVSSLGTTPVKTSYLSLSSLLNADETLRSDGENGFLSLTFHPNFATNRTLYVYFSIDVGGTLFQRLHQVTVSSATANTVTIAQHKPLLTILDRDTNHNGGDIDFGADGFLYLSTGDEGGGGDNRNNARFINTVNVSGTRRTGFWGQMLRIAVEVDPVGQPGVFPAGVLTPNAAPQNSTTFPSSTHGNHRIPADNPFIGYTRWHSLTIDPATVRTEIYATGLRNPFRWSFDPLTGRLFLGDVGQGIWEEVNLIVKGGDYGWSWREGDNVYNSPPAPTTPPPPAGPGDPPGTGFNPIAPIFQYDHTDSGNGDIYGNVIAGGAVMRGNRLPELYGAYIYADIGSGQIVALRESGTTWTPQIIANDTNIIDFGYDPRNGDLLLCDSSTVERLTRTGTTGTNPPALLSQTGAFSNLANLTPHPGIVAYAPNVPFWSDYATKLRWFSIKNTTDTIGFSANGNWTFPTGMVWVKHFDIETTRGNPATKRKLETRFLVKTATDIYGLSYKWRADQTDADLVAEGGLTEAIPSSNPAQTWRFPSRSECKQCHTPNGGFALSSNTRQLNRNFDYGVLSQNQILALSNAGYFSSSVTGIHHLPAFARSEDTTQSLESRVRSYLAVNCVQCHQPGGTAQGNWDARPTTSTDAANLINGTLVNTSGDPANRFVVPGDLTHSMALRRIQGDGVPRMPPIATNERDLAAEQLLTDWINLALPTRQNFAQWQQANFGGTGGANAQPGADPDGDGDKNSLEFLRGTGPNTPTVPFVSSITSGIAAGNFTLQFTQPANRAALVETTTDFQTWSLWNVPGNAPSYPAANVQRILSGPIDAPNRFFRIQLNEQ